MKKFDSLNAHTRVYKHTVNSQPSATIPDQSMSIKQILTRYASGIMPEQTPNPYYHEEGDPEQLGVHPSQLDLIDKMELLAEQKKLTKGYRQKKH